LLFLWLFFYVCWPYDATPETPGASYPGWSLMEIDAETGGFRFGGSEVASSTFSPGAVLYLVDGNLPIAQEGVIGAFEVIAADEAGLLTRPTEPLTPEQFDWVLAGLGPWTFYDKAPGAWPSHYADRFEEKANVPPDFFLRLDPLVGITTGLASRSWAAHSERPSIFLTKESADGPAGCGFAGADGGCG
jgi:hypothetical protein